MFTPASSCVTAGEAHVKQSSQLRPFELPMNLAPVQVDRWIYLTASWQGNRSEGGLEVRIRSMYTGITAHDCRLATMLAGGQRLDFFKRPRWPASCCFPDC